LRIDYDRIGEGYARTRRPDPRIATRIVDALADADSVANIGAGAGSYEPRDRPVVAVEPSELMIRQRGHDAASAVLATAEALPFPDAAFDAAMAIFTVHHWSDRARGIREMKRVTRHRVIVVTWDEEVWESFWLVREYFPGIANLDRPRAVDISELAGALGGATVISMPVPHDCVDGFHGAFWRRPQAYLDPAIRAGISTYALMPRAELNDGLRRLQEDLDSGAWLNRHEDLMTLDEIDLGYRLIVSEACA
jgi:SAM-dependent methyltransferase